MVKNQLLVTSLMVSVFSVTSLVCADSCKESLRPVRDVIYKEYIHQSSEDVAEKVKKRDPLSQQFQTHLEEDEKMQKVFQIYGDGTGEFSIDVINLKDEVNQEFENKNHELQKEVKFWDQAEVWAKIAIPVGALVCLGAFAATTTNNRHKGMKNFRIAGAVTGAVGVAGGYTVWSWSLDGQETTNTHLKENIVMQEKLKNAFYLRHKQQQKKADQQ